MSHLTRSSISQLRKPSSKVGSSANAANVANISAAAPAVDAGSLFSFLKFHLF